MSIKHPYYKWLEPHFINDIYDGDIELSKMSFEVFFAEVDLNVKELNDCLNKKEFELVSDISHKVKGMCRYVLNDQFDDIFNQIEYSVSKHDTEKIFVQLKVLNAYIEEFSVDVSSYLEVI